MPIRIIPPQLTKTEWNALLYLALAKTSSFIVRINEGYYEAIWAYGTYGGQSETTQAGRLAYGGSGNQGGISGSSFEAVIEACLSTLSNGGSILTKSASYEVDDQIDWSQNDIMLFGERGTIFTFPDTLSVDRTMIDMTGDRNRISNIFFDGIRDQVSGNQDAVLIDGGLYNTIDNNRFEAFTSDAIVCDNASSYCFITNNLIYDIYSRGLNLNDIRHSVISGNILRHIGVSGVDTDGALYSTFAYNIFEDTSFWANDNALELEQEETSPTHTEFCTVIGNTFLNGYCGVHINSGRNNTVIGNSFDSFVYGIRIQTAGGTRYSTRNIIKGNRFGTITTNPIIEIDANQDYNVIVGNIFPDSPNNDLKGVNDEIGHNIGG